MGTSLLFPGSHFILVGSSPFFLGHQHSCRCFSVLLAPDLTFSAFMGVGQFSESGFCLIGPMCLFLSYRRGWDVVLVLWADSLAVGSGESPLGTLIPDYQLVSGGQLAPSRSCSFQALHISATQPHQEGR